MGELVQKESIKPAKKQKTFALTGDKKDSLKLSNPTFSDGRGKASFFTYHSIMLAIFLFFLLISIQWGAGLFNYYVLNKTLFVNFGAFNKVGDVFFNNKHILYWLSGWGRDNMFGIMWFSIWSAICIFFLLTVFTWGEEWIWVQAAFPFIWIFLWIMAAYPTVRIVRDVEKHTGAYIALLTGIGIIVLGAVVACFAAPVGGIIIIGGLITLLVSGLSGSFTWLTFGMLVWGIVSYIFTGAFIFGMIQGALGD